MWRTKQHDGEKGGQESDDPWGVGGNSGGRKASGVDPNTHGVEWEEGVREAYGVEKTPGGSAKEWRGGSRRPWTNRPATERAGGSSRHGMI